MKKAILTVLALALITCAHSQNAKKTADGNFQTIAPVPKPGKAIGKTISDGGKSYPVFETAKGKLYYEKISKAGKLYRKYIKIEN